MKLNARREREEEELKEEMCKRIVGEKGSGTEEDSGVTLGLGTEIGKGEGKAKEEEESEEEDSPEAELMDMAEVFDASDEAREEANDACVDASLPVSPSLLMVSPTPIRIALTVATSVLLLAALFSGGIASHPCPAFVRISD